MTQTIIGTPLHKIGQLQVWQTDTNSYIVTGGKYDLFFEQMPTVDELQMLMIKPKNCLNAYEQWQLEKKGNILISKQQLFNDLTTIHDNWFNTQVQLSELGY